MMHTRPSSPAPARGIVLALILVLAALLTVLAPAASARDKTNVIIIFTDDLGWGDLGCFGSEKFKTPHLDRMAQEGVRLTDFYVPTPYCAPSRASLLTGRYPFRHGVTGNPAPDAGIHDIGIPATEVTLGEVFQAADYRTICIGKWHLGHKPEFFPTRHGFHEYFGILYSNDMRPVELIEGEEKVEYPVIQADLTKRYTERALAFMERNREKPFFLYLAHAMPHKPLAASEDFFHKSGEGLYADVMAELDWSVGQILSKLKDLELDENTLVFFMSDNGPWFGGSAGGLRGMKASSWEGGIRVPLIARWPGKIPPGQVRNAPTILMDVFTTALIAAGLPIPEGRVIDGRNLLPVMKGEAGQLHESLFSMYGPDLATVRSGKWKLHVKNAAGPKPMKPGEPYTDPRAPDGVTIIAPCEQAHPSQYPGLVTGDEAAPMSLFDLDADPGEQLNVAGQHPGVVERLKKLYDSMLEEARGTSAEPKGHSKH